MVSCFLVDVIFEQHFSLNSSGYLRIGSNDMLNEFSVGSLQFPFVPDSSVVRHLCLYICEDAVSCTSRTKNRVCYFMSIDCFQVQKSAEFWLSTKWFMISK